MPYMHLISAPPPPKLDDEATIANRCWEIMLAMEEPELCVPLCDSSLLMLFMKEIIGLSRLPMYALAQIYRKLHGDLAVLAGLIDGYREHDSISALLDKQRRPDNHRARMTVTFYVRCIKEQHRLVRKLERAEDEALMMSNQELVSMKGVFGFAFSWHSTTHQLPISHRLRIREFDATKIDRVFHRISHLPVREGHRIAKIYESGAIDHFYQELGRSRPAARVFDSMQARIRSREKLNHLARTINELRLLFDRDMWSGFYALALPQIEGIASAMLTTLGRAPGSSLTDKLLGLWDRYSLANPVFDYFAWHLPEQRNRFAHSGRLPGEPRWVAHDILYDLHYILTVYEELDAPWIQLETLLKQQETSGPLPDITWLSRAIQSLDQIDKQKTPYPATFSNFVTKLAKQKRELDQLIQDADKVFTEKAVDFVSTFNALASAVVDDFDISRRPNFDVTTVRSQLSELFEREDLVGRDVVVAYIRLIQGLKKHMNLDYTPNLEPHQHLAATLRRLKLA